MVRLNRYQQQFTLDLHSLKHEKRTRTYEIIVLNGSCSKQPTFDHGWDCAGESNASLALNYNRNSHSIFSQFQTGGVGRKDIHMETQATVDFLQKNPQSADMT